MSLASIIQLEPFNINSSASFTFANVTTTGNISSAGNITAAYLIGNGSQLTGIVAGTNYTNTNVSSYLGTFTGLVAAGNVTATGNVTAAYLIGDGSQLTGTIPTANYAAYAGNVINATQSNITSIGTLTSLAVTNDVTIGGNLTVSGTQTTVNSTTVNINDINIVLANNATTAAQANGAGITINGASANWIYNSTSNAFSFSHPISANGSLLTAINGSNVTSTVATATTAGTVTTNAQPNITSIGTLTGLTSGGTVNFTTASNVTLGAVSNVHITGGASGQLLQTDGAGNVAWVTPTGTTITVDNFTGDGSQTAYTLTATPTSKAYTMVALAGTLQPRTVYSLTGNVVTFSSAPPATAPIEITTFSIATGTGTSDITANTLTANAVTANTLSGNIISATSSLTVNTLAANTLSSNNIVNTGTGTPTLNSSTSINLTAATVVRATTSPFQFYNCTTTVRDAIAASNGYVIYNTTTNKLQVYANGTWVDLH